MASTKISVSRRKKNASPEAWSNSTWWARKTADEAAKTLVKWADDAIRQNLYRASRAYRFASLFEGFTLNNLSSFGAEVNNDQVFDGLNVPIIRNKTRRLVMTVVNKCFANDDIAPQFVTKGADYDQMLAAENLDDAMMAEFDQEQGDFSNIHEMWRHLGMIATSATGRGYIFAFPGENQVEAELDDSLTVGVIKNGQFGSVQTLVRSVWKDPEHLKEKYPKQAAEIEKNIDMRAAPIVSGVTGDATTLRSDTVFRREVRVIQGWRCKVGRTAGRRMYVLKDGTILGKSDTVWDKTRPPCVWWDYEREIGGEGGTPLTHTVYRQAMRQNEITHDMDRSQHDQAQVTYLVQKGTQDAVAIKGQLQEAVGVKIVEIHGKVGEAVQVMENRGLANNSLQLEQIYDNGMHDDTGIAKNQTSGSGQPGTTSGIQESLRASYLTENLADQTRRLVRARGIDTTRIFVWALQEMIENKDNEFERWVGDTRFRRQLKSTDLDLDESKYIMSIKAVSADKDSPQTRLQKAEKLLADPTVPFTGSDMVEVWKTLDIDRLAEELFAIEEWVQNQHKRWLKATKTDMTNDAFYQSPSRWMGLDGLKTALRITAARYLWARQEGVPATRLRYFEKFNDECVDLIQKEELRIAQNQGNVKPAATETTQAAAPVAAPPQG